MVASLSATAKRLGLPFGKRTRTYNSRLAQELGLWAEEQGKGHQFHMAAFRGYFADGLNLAKKEVLLGLAEQLELPVAEADRVIEQRLFKDRVDKDWADSRFMGINAVPTFVMGRHKLVGAQEYTALQELVELYGINSRG
jgi:predicted DsbA family dithiol-disulfide isomerase